MGAIVRGALMDFIATIINAIHELILIAIIVGVLVLAARHPRLPPPITAPQRHNGRLAQRLSTRFTRVGSLVQSQYRPPFCK